MIKPGDWLISVNGIEYGAHDFSDCVQKLRERPILLKFKHPPKTRFLLEPQVQNSTSSAVLVRKIYPLKKKSIFSDYFPFFLTFFIIIIILL